MADRPIIFSAPMVRAVMEGRKTQTRRVLPEKYRGMLRPAHSVSNGPNGPMAHEYDRSWPVRTPWQVGDRLWVKERLDRANGEAVGYPADGSWLPNTPWLWQRNSLPSIHCPRRLSRLTLTVTDVRVERLQDISEADAIAEGLEWVVPGMWAVDRTLPIIGDDPVRVYSELWDSINGPGAWEQNPWVAAVSFDVRRGNIDGGSDATR